MSDFLMFSFMNVVTYKKSKGFRVCFFRIKQLLILYSACNSDNGKYVHHNKIR